MNTASSSVSSCAGRSHGRGRARSCSRTSGGAAGWPSRACSSRRPPGRPARSSCRGCFFCTLCRPACSRRCTSSRSTSSPALTGCCCARRRTTASACGPSSAPSSTSASPSRSCGRCCGCVMVPGARAVHSFAFGRPARLLVVGLAVASLGATTWLFIRETKPFGDTRLAAVKAHLSAADLRAIDVPVDYADAVPVLTYHDVSTRPGPYAVTPQMFAKQMAALRRGGFHTVSLDQVRDLVQGRRTSLPSRPVLLTFDDGVSTDYTRADAILAANHFRAAAFVVTSRLGDGRKPSYYLSWPQVRKMAHSGRWEFGSETDAGASESSTLSAGDLARSAAKLRRALGAAPYAFAFPVTLSSLPAKPAAMADVESGVAGPCSLGLATPLHAPHAIDATSEPLLLPRFAVTAQLDVAGLADA